MKVSRHYTIQFYKDMNNVWNYYLMIHILDLTLRKIKSYQMYFMLLPGLAISIFLLSWLKNGVHIYLTLMINSKKPQQFMPLLIITMTSFTNCLFQVVDHSESTQPLIVCCIMLLPMVILKLLKCLWLMIYNKRKIKEIYTPGNLQLWRDI